MSAEGTPTEQAQEGKKEALNRQLEGVSWGLFLIWMGGLWLAPEGWKIPDGVWLIGAGVIMLLLNGIRCIVAIGVSPFTLILGVVALGLGLSDVFHVKLPVFPILLLVVGAGVIFAAFSKRTRRSTRTKQPPSD